MCMDQEGRAVLDRLEHLYLVMTSPSAANSACRYRPSLEVAPSQQDRQSMWAPPVPAGFQQHYSRMLAHTALGHDIHLHGIANT